MCITSKRQLEPQSTIFFFFVFRLIIYLIGRNTTGRLQHFVPVDTHGCLCAWQYTHQSSYIVPLLPRFEPVNSIQQVTSRLHWVMCERHFVTPVLCHYVPTSEGHVFVKKIRKRLYTNKKVLLQLHVILISDVNVKLGTNYVLGKQSKRNKCTGIMTTWDSPL